MAESLLNYQRKHAAILPGLDFAGVFLSKPEKFCDETSSEPPTGTNENPEVNIRQRDAPSDGFSLCALFFARIMPTFPVPGNEEGRADV